MNNILCQEQQIKKYTLLKVHICHIIIKKSFNIKERFFMKIRLFNVLFILFLVTAGVTQISLGDYVNIDNGNTCN